MSIFDPKHKSFNIINFVFTIVGLIIGIISTYILLKQLDTSEQFYYLNKPKLILIGNPIIDSTSLQMKLEKFPSYLKLDTNKEPEHFHDSSLSKIFLPTEPTKKTKKFLLSSDLKLNVDSITEKEKNSLLTDKAYIKFNLSIKLLNVGNVSANNIWYMCGDTLSTQAILRNEILSKSEDVNYINSELKPFGIKSQNVNDTQTIKIENYCPQFFDNKNEFIFHLAIFYQGYDQRYYDTYIKFLFKLKESEVRIIEQPLYTLVDKNLYKLETIVLHYPDKPNLSDFVKVISSDFEYDFVYSTHQNKLINEFIFKQKK